MPPDVDVPIRSKVIEEAMVRSSSIVYKNQAGVEVVQGGIVDHFEILFYITN